MKIPAILALFSAALFVGAQGSLPPNVHGPVSSDPIVLAKSAVIMDAVTGRVLWSREPDTKRYPASTTKIMTTLLALEARDRNSLVTAPADVTRVGGSSLYLKPSEKISYEDALYAMMLRSANDVCHAVAVDIGGSIADFADRMNERARAIGCTGTHFTNPHGLPDPNHVTTARDLALIGREAMRNAVFRSIVRTQTRTIERSQNSTDVLLVNRNRWLKKDPTADGIKTGFTRASGSTYVGSAVRNGFRVITVVLGTENWQADHQSMLDWAFENYQVGIRGDGRQIIGRLPVAGGIARTVPVISESPVQVLTRTDADPSIEMTWASADVPAAPIEVGQRLGQILIRDGDGFEVKVPVRAGASVARSLQSSTFQGASWYILGGAMLCGAWVMRRKSRIA